MNLFKHLPWTIRRDDDHWGVFDSRDVLVTYVSVSRLGFSTPEDRELALMIAALPELFDALEMVRDADEDCRKDGLDTIPSLPRAKIDAALAKAVGR